MTKKAVLIVAIQFVLSPLSFGEKGHLQSGTVSNTRRQEISSEATATKIPKCSLGEDSKGTLRPTVDGVPWLVRWKSNEDASCGTLACALRGLSYLEKIGKCVREARFCTPQEGRIFLEQDRDTNKHVILWKSCYDRLDEDLQPKKCMERNEEQLEIFSDLVEQGICKSFSNYCTLKALQNVWGKTFGFTSVVKGFQPRHFDEDSIIEAQKDLERYWKAGVCKKNEYTPECRVSSETTEFGSRYRVLISGIYTGDHPSAHASRLFFSEEEANKRGGELESAGVCRLRKTDPKR